MKRIYIVLILALSLSCGHGRNTGEISASGTIEATDVVVSSKVGGQINALYFSEGETVEKGDTLAIIDHSTLELQLQQAESGIEVARSQLNLLLSGARIEDLKQAEEALEQAKANLELAKEELDRTKTLYESDVATEQQMDQVRTQYRIANAKFNSAKQNLEKLKKYARPEEIQMARAKLAQAKSQYEVLKKQIEDCYIRSPLTGTIINKPVEIGELAGKGSVITKISDLSVVDLMIYVTEVEMGKVKIGQPAEISIDSYPNRTFDGKVVYISPEAEFTPKNIQTKEERVKLVFGVKIQIENPDQILKAGMPADAQLK